VRTEVEVQKRGQTEANEHRWRLLLAAAEFSPIFGSALSRVVLSNAT
jgi:hypothetical protein